MSLNALEKAARLLDNGNAKQAESELVAAFGQNPVDDEAKILLGRTAIMLDDFDRAMDLLEPLAKTRSEDHRVFELLGEVYGLKAQHAGLIKGAMLMPKIKSSFQKALTLAPDSLRAHEGLYMFYLFVPGMAGGDEAKAEAMIDEISALNPARGHVARALYLTKRNQENEALQEYDQALNKGINDAELLLKIGRFYLTTNHVSRAKDVFQKLVEMQPENPGAVNGLGRVYSAGKNWPEAIGMYTRAIEINPYFLPARIERAEAFIENGNSAAATADLDFAMQNNAAGPILNRAKSLRTRL